jgi:hypothetical protein
MEGLTMFIFYPAWGIVTGLSGELIDTGRTEFIVLTDSAGGRERQAESNF